MVVETLDHELSKAQRNDAKDSNMFIWCSMWEDRYSLRSRDISCPHPLGVYDEEGRTMRQCFDAFNVSGGMLRKKRVSLPVRSLRRTSTRRGKPKKKQPAVTSSSSSSESEQLLLYSKRRGFPLFKNKSGAVSAVGGTNGTGASGGARQRLGPIQSGG